MEFRNIVTIILLHICFVSFELQPSKAAQPWIKVGYWEYSPSGIPISDINSSLFTHLVYCHVGLNYSSYELSTSADTNVQDLAKFVPSVKQTNPSITTLLKILVRSRGNFSELLNHSSYRRSLIDSSIKIARRYGFQGLQFLWDSTHSMTDSDMKNKGKLFQEWRVAINDEARNSNQDKLILTCMLSYLPVDFLTASLLPSMLDNHASYPVDSFRDNLDWVALYNCDYHNPSKQSFTGPNSALFDPKSDADTDSSIRAWIEKGLPASKLVLGVCFYGVAWNLTNPSINVIGAPTTGPAISKDGRITYKEVKDFIDRNDAQVRYNATYVFNYCSVGSTWIGFDDAHTIETKVSYAMENNLLGYHVSLVYYDDNFELSRVAYQVVPATGGPSKRRLLLIILVSIPTVTFTVAFLLFFFWIRVHNSKVKIPKSAQDFNRNHSNLRVFSLEEIKLASNGFSIENKLGEGGYGPVYKGVFPNGLEIAVKKLSKSSTQGFEELKNEIDLTARLQHVNLVKVLGFCIEGDEKLLVYEYMPNKSLDNYLFDPIRRRALDWRKRINIIEGVTQGLLYIQEYSRLTIIHRDLKPSNILLDNEMNPKISDFGMARIFAKDALEANTDTVVGTYGYIPPEYLGQGIYSMKSDVYSFGVLLLQIISGQRNAQIYGPNEDLSLLEYAYELWKDGKGMEFMDPVFDDTLSLRKAMRCMQIALFCVQKNANDRPSMLEVSSMLKNENAEMGIPEKPGFSFKKEDQNQESNATLHLNICSVDKATITEVVAK